jgi:hypothetical protein
VVGVAFRADEKTADKIVKGASMHHGIKNVRACCSVRYAG